MSDHTDEYDHEMPLKQGPEAVAGEKFTGGGNLVTMYQAQQSANAESFPVLQAFQEYIEAERQQSRKRVVQLSISFAIIIGVVVTGFLAAGVYVMQDTTKRLFQMAEKNAVPAAAPALTQVAQAATPNSAALEESIRQMSLVLTQMQSEKTRTSAQTAPAAPAQHSTAVRDPELDALKAELVAMKERSRELEGSLAGLRDGQGVVAQEKPVAAVKPRYSVEDALEISRQTGARKAAGDKEAADKLAQVKAEAEKLRLAEFEATQKAAEESAALAAKVELEALAKRDEVARLAALQKVAPITEELPDARYPVADKLPPEIPQGVTAPLPPKEMMAVSVPLKTKTGGVVPWRIFVPE